jgi:hypothetical protein
MNEFEKARSFGLITIPEGQMCFHVHTDRYNFISVETSGYPIHAMWQGDQIIVKMNYLKLNLSKILLLFPLKENIF